MQHFLLRIGIAWLYCRQFSSLLTAYTQAQTATILAGLWSVVGIGLYTLKIICYITIVLQNPTNF